MKDFNENPFKKDTPVIPFSSGTDAMNWSSFNCEKCIHYENESTHVKEAKCKLAFYLDLGQADGTIPLWVAKEIGCEYDPLYGFVKLSGCRKFDDGNRPF